MTIIGSAYVDIRAITEKLEEDIKRALAILPDHIDIKVEADTRPAEDQIDLLMAWADEHHVNIDVAANTVAAETHIDEIVAEHHEASVNVDADTAAATAHIQDFMAVANDHEINVPVDVQDLGARVGLMALMAEWGHKILDWRVVVSTALAEVQLGILARPRFAKIFPEMGASEHLDQSFDNIGRFLMGISGGTALKGLIEEAIQTKMKLGEMVPQIAMTAEKIGGMATAATGAAGGLLSLGSSLVDILGVAPALPGVFVGLEIAMKITTTAFGDMKKAAPDLAKEIANLKKEIGEDFWSKARTGLNDLVSSTGVFRESLRVTSKDVGNFWGTMFEGMSKGSFAKGMAGDFKNLDAGINTITKSSGVFLHIFEVLGEFGSAYIPKLADGFVGLSKRFDEFLSKANEDGQLKKWVDGGVSALKDLGHVVGEVGSIFGGLADAANKAGGMTLGVLGGSLQRLSDTIHTADFQKNLVMIFQGANSAIGDIVGGLGKFMGAIGYLAPALKIVETQIGQTLGKALDLIAGTLKRPEVAKGLTDMFGGIKEGVDHLTQAMDPVGKKLGSVMSFVGSIAANLGDVVGHAAAVLIPPIQSMLDTIKPLTPLLGDVVKHLTDWLAPVLGMLAKDVIPPAVDALKKILPAITNLIDAITPDVVELMKAFGASLNYGKGGQPQKDADGINALAKSIKDGQKDFKSWTDGLKALDDATAWMTSTKHTQDFHNSTVSMFNDFGKNNQKLSEDIRKNADNMFGPMNKAVEKMNKDVNKGLDDFWTDVKKNNDGMDTDFRNNWNNFWGGLDGFNKDTSKKVNDDLGHFWTDVGKNNDGMDKDFRKGWNDFWGGLKGFDKDTSKKVNDDLKSFWGDAQRNNEGVGKDFMKGWDGMWKDFNTATKPVADTVGKIGEHLGKLWGALVSRPIDDFAKKWNAGWEKIKQGNEGLSKDINKNISQWWSDVSAGFTTNMTKIGTAWDKGWNGLKSGNAKISSDINKAVSTWWTGVSNDFTKGADKIGKDWSKGWNDLKSTNTKVSGDINKSVNTWWTGVSGDFTRGANQIGKDWSKGWNDLKTTNTKLSADINKNVSKWWTDISAPFVKQGAQIGKDWNKTWSDIQTTNQKTSADINKSLSQWWSDISAGWTTSTTQLKSGWDDFWNGVSVIMKTVGDQIQKAIDNFWKGVQDAWNTAMGVIKDIEKRGWDAIFEYLNGLWSDMMAAGGHIIDGLVHGIQDGIGAVGKAIAGVGQSVLDGIGKIMNMHSPSREMYDRGVWTVQGYVNGMVDHGVHAVDAMTDIASRVLEASTIKVPSFDTGALFGAAQPQNPNIFTASAQGNNMPVPASYGYPGASPQRNATVVNPTVNVYPSAPLNETQVGQMAASQLYWEFTNRY